MGSEDSLHRSIRCLDQNSQNNSISGWNPYMVIFWNMALKGIQMLKWTLPIFISYGEFTLPNCHIFFNFWNPYVMSTEKFFTCPFWTGFTYLCKWDLSGKGYYPIGVMNFEYPTRQVELDSGKLFGFFNLIHHAHIGTGKSTLMKIRVTLHLGNRYIYLKLLIIKSECNWFWKSSLMTRLM